MKKRLEGKSVLLGITSAIASYKMYDFIRMLRRQGANVECIVTKNALNFVSKLTLQTLSSNRLYDDQFQVERFEVEHIKLVERHDIFVIAPCSANTLGKIANGICDNLLSTIACAFSSKPIIICPSMNCDMWENEFVKRNIEKLKCSKNIKIIEPEEGFLACNKTGKGRLCSLDSIFECVEISLKNRKGIDFSDKRVLVSCGGTREQIDPVRYICNYSSGKMGLNLAKTAYFLNAAEVTLVGTTEEYINSPFRYIKVSTAEEMRKVLHREFVNSDILFMTAAVSDFRVENSKENKIKKDEICDNLVLNLTKNPDILRELSNCKNGKQLVVGFCAQTENLVENAKEKLKKKDCDIIIANDVKRKDIGFQSDFNEVLILDKKDNFVKIDKDTKGNIAFKILEFVYENWL